MKISSGGTNMKTSWKQPIIIENLSPSRKIRDIKKATFGGFAALKEDGSVVTWGRKEHEHCGDLLSVSSAEISEGVENIYATKGAFAALKVDGSVVTWGYRSFGGDSSNIPEGEICCDIISNNRAFLARMEGGYSRYSIAWGQKDHGGDSDYWGMNNYSPYRIEKHHQGFFYINGDEYPSAAFFGGTYAPMDDDLLCEDVYHFVGIQDATYLFKMDGSIVDAETGEIIGDLGVEASEIPKDVYEGTYHPFIMHGPQAADGWRNVFLKHDACAVIKGDGSVFTWGDVYYGGDITIVADKLTSGVKKIVGENILYEDVNDECKLFAALKCDGSVIVWGGCISAMNDPELMNDPEFSEYYDHDEKLYIKEKYDRISIALKNNVKDIFSSEHFFVAQREDGTAVVWTNYYSLFEIPHMSEIKTIYSTHNVLLIHDKEYNLHIFGVPEVETNPLERFSIIDRVDKIIFFDEGPSFCFAYRNDNSLALLGDAPLYIGLDANPESEYIPVWSGRGEKPEWFLSAEKRGKTQEEMLL
jgi:hypothetical protein